MSDYFTNLALLALGTPARIRPRPLSRFAGDQTPPEALPADEARPAPDPQIRHDDLSSPNLSRQGSATVALPVERDDRARDGAVVSAPDELPRAVRPVAPVGPIGQHAEWTTSDPRSSDSGSISTSAPAPIASAKPVQSASHGVSRGRVVSSASAKSQPAKPVTKGRLQTVEDVSAGIEPVNTIGKLDAIGQVDAMEQIETIEHLETIEQVQAATPFAGRANDSRFTNEQPFTPLEPDPFQMGIEADHLTANVNPRSAIKGRPIAPASKQAAGSVSVPKPTAKSIARYADELTSPADARPIPAHPQTAVALEAGLAPTGLMTSSAMDGALRAGLKTLHHQPADARAMPPGAKRRHLGVGDDLSEASSAAARREVGKSNDFQIEPVDASQPIQAREVPTRSTLPRRVTTEDNVSPPRDRHLSQLVARALGGVAPAARSMLPAPSVPAPSVVVHIGRVEVRQAAPPTPPPRLPRPRPAVTDLQQYLRARAGEGA